MRRFGLLIVVVAAIGLTIALVSDASTDNRDAWREVGGALLAGAVLAGLVVWFEDRREDQREEIHDRREDAAARRAWRREIDIRFVSVVRSELAARRIEWLESLEEDTKPRHVAIGIDRLTEQRTDRLFPSVIAEVDALLHFLREPDLSRAWESWDDASQRLQDDVGAPPEQPRRRAEQFAMNVELPATRDPGQHATAAAIEQTAWEHFITSVDRYIERAYPIEAAPVTS